MAGRIGARPVVEERIRAHLERGDAERGATEAIRSYGPEVLAYLRAILGDQDTADDVFAEFAEHLWKGIAGFRGDSTVAAWVYAVAWGAARRTFGDGYRKRRRRLETSACSKLAEEVRASSVVYLRTEVKNAVARLRDSLSPEERTLLILRIDRGLSWRDVAVAMGEQGMPLEEGALRKRFERLKGRLQRLAAEQGLLGSR